MPAEVQPASPPGKVLPFEEIDAFFRKDRIVQVFHPFIRENPDNFLRLFVPEIHVKNGVSVPSGPDMALSFLTYSASYPPSVARLIYNFIIIFRPGTAPPLPRLPPSPTPGTSKTLEP